jgi:hypothetical protein
MSWHRSRKWLPWAGSILVHAAIVIALLVGARRFDFHIPVVTVVPESKPDPPDLDYTITLRDWPDPPPRRKTVVPTAPKTLVQQPSPRVEQPASVQATPVPPVGAPAPGGTGDSVPRPADLPLHQPLRNGQSIVYVLDRSGSMGEAGQLGRAVRRLLASLRGLPPTVRFQVIAYNRTPELLGGDFALMPATDCNVARVAERILGLTAEGTSAHVAALDKALRLRPDAVFFLSDGGDLTIEQAQKLSAGNAGKACVHAVVFGNRPASGVRELASRNRGSVTVVP